MRLGLQRRARQIGRRRRSQPGVESIEPQPGRGGEQLSEREQARRLPDPDRRYEADGPGRPPTACSSESPRWRSAQVQGLRSRTPSGGRDGSCRGSARPGTGSRGRAARRACRTCGSHDPLSMKKGRASSDWFVHRPVTASGVGVGVELGSSLYRLLVGGQGRLEFAPVAHLLRDRQAASRWRLWERRVHDA